MEFSRQDEDVQFVLAEDDGRSFLMQAILGILGEPVLARGVALTELVCGREGREAAFAWGRFQAGKFDRVVDDVLEGGERRVDARRVQVVGDVGFEVVL